MRKFIEKYGFVLLFFICPVLICIGAIFEPIRWLGPVAIICTVVLAVYLFSHEEPSPKPEKLTYKDAALCYPDMAEARRNIAKARAEAEQAGDSAPSNYYAAGDSIYPFVKNGDPEFDVVPVDELVQQHASELGKTIETEEEYLRWALWAVETGHKSICEFHDRKVNSILRRKLGIPTSIVEFKKYLAWKDPFVTYAWNDRLNSCKAIYTVKFYRLDGRPEKGVPAEEYEYMDDKEAAEEHFERFRNDRSLLYSRVELTEVSAATPEKVLQAIVFLFESRR